MFLDLGVQHGSSVRLSHILALAAQLFIVLVIKGTRKASRTMCVGKIAVKAHEKACNAATMNAWLFDVNQIMIA